MFRTAPTLQKQPVLHSSRPTVGLKAMSSTRSKLRSMTCTLHRAKQALQHSSTHAGPAT